jgi:hypothetical protein
MAYTFWHAGILIGDSDFEERTDSPRQRGGVFRPTAHGLALFPYLSGMLSVAHEFKLHLDSINRSPEDLDDEEIREIFESTPLGKKVLDIGRTLSEVELRRPDGRVQHVVSIAFSDLHEMKRLARDQALAPSDAEVTTEAPADAPRYMVSATFRYGAPESDGGGVAGRLRRRRSYEH